jgi:Fe-S-cluster containining protein
MTVESNDKRQNYFSNICSQCKTRYRCCHDTRPPITSNRRKIIEAYLKAAKITLERAFTETDYVYPRLNSGKYCIFHDKTTRKCLVHPVKPETCVAGPITFDINKKTKRIEWYIKMEKTCQLAGVVYKSRKVLLKHLKSAKKELRRLLNELDSEALIAILKKEEPETFKIGEDSVDEEILDKLSLGELSGRD